MSKEEIVMTVAKDLAVAASQAKVIPVSLAGDVGRQTAKAYGDVFAALVPRVAEVYDTLTLGPKPVKPKA